MVRWMMWLPRGLERSDITGILENVERDDMRRLDIRYPESQSQSDVEGDVENERCATSQDS
jgi:hypothetical protein